MECLVSLCSFVESISRLIDLRVLSVSSLLEGNAVLATGNVLSHNLEVSVYE